MGTNPPFWPESGGAGGAGGKLGVGTGTVIVTTLSLASSSSFDSLSICREVKKVLAYSMWIYLANLATALALLPRYTVLMHVFPVYNPPRL